MPPRDEDEAIERWTEALVDGAPIDWEAEAARAPQLATAIESLRRVEQLIHAHGVIGAEWSRLHDTPIAPGAPAQEAPPRSDERGERWGRLQLREHLASGGFGSVYRAYDPVLDREVALKLFENTPGFHPGRFLAEARRLARVRHRGVVVIHGADVQEGQVGLWTDLIAGQTLEERLRAQGPASAGEAATMGMELCRALAAVHGAGLVHRDVKGANVMREAASGRIVLMDFGASAVREGPPDALLSEGGTPFAMAPEQLMGQNVGPTADLYGLGVLLYRLLTKRYPFEAESFAELTRLKLSGEHVPLGDARPDLPPALVRVIDRALEPDPAARFQTAGAMERALASAIGSAVPVTPSGGPRTLLRTWILVAGAASALGVLWLVSPRFRPHTSTGPAGTRAEHSSAVPAAAPAQSPLVVEGPVSASIRLFRATNGQRRLLHSGDRVAPHDALYLEIESTDTLYAYVLDQDRTGRSYVLFPLPGMTPSNPLAPDGIHRLPGRLKGRQLDWQVTSAGGDEAIAVLATRKPVMNFASAVARLPLARVDGGSAAVPNGRAAGEPLRSIGSLTEEPPDSTPSADVVTLLERIALRQAAPTKPLVWKIVLRNPRSADAQ